MRRVLLVALCLLGSGCDDLDEFKATGGPDGVFRGVVIGGDSDLPGGGSFIRRGFPPGTELRLTFDPALANPGRVMTSPPSPGTLTTNDVCMSEPSFHLTPLEPIVPLSNDLLSQYEFPGGGRVRNYLFAAHARSGCLAGRDAMVFLSLMDDGGIEARIVVGAGGDTPNERFGVFVTTRQPP